VRKLAVASALVVLALPAAAARLPILAPQDLWPVYAPNGLQVAFTVAQGRSFQLDVLDAATKRVFVVASAAGQPSPTWSSDGRIAYASGGVLRKANARGTGKYVYPSRTPAFAPAWQPHGEQLAYLTSSGAQNLDLWVGGTLWAKGVIGKPAWSPDGTTLAFQRAGSIWAATRPLVEVQLAATSGEPGPPAWSPDGTRLAYSADGRVYVVPADASAGPTQIAGPLKDVGPLTWSPAGDALAFTAGGNLELASLGGGTSVLARGAGTGASFAPTDPHGRVLVYSAPIASCPGHLGIRAYGQGQLTGSCVITGTGGDDVIEGTPLPGDVIRAGAGNDRVHANDGHSDRVECGLGRDVVWADERDTLSGCEIVHR
jgi:Tol biopolymer transport system component